MTLTFVIEISPAERRRLVQYVTAPFNAHASVQALDDEAKSEPEDIEDWWLEMKRKASVA